MQTLPPIPSSIHTPLGPVAVELVPDLRASDGDCALGLWCPEERAIKLRAGMALVATWTTLEHERVHQICWDSGTGLRSDLEERVADAISTARVALMLHGDGG